MTCAKRRVKAVLVGASGYRYIGTNACTNPQEVCPREHGEGYDKCRSVCGQAHHAEVDALLQAGEDAMGGTMRVDHTYACAGCIAAMNAAGVARIVVGVDFPDER